MLAWETWSLIYLWRLQACWMVFAALLVLFCVRALLPASKMLSANLFCLWECQAVCNVLAAASSACCRSLIALCLSCFLCSSSGQYNDLALWGEEFKKTANRLKPGPNGLLFIFFYQSESPVCPEMCLQCDHCTFLPSLLLHRFLSLCTRQRIPYFSSTNKNTLCSFTTRLFKCRKHGQLYQ